MNRNLTRRDFVKATSFLAGAATATIVPRHVLGGAGQSSPSQKLNPLLTIPAYTASSVGVLASGVVAES